MGTRWETQLDAVLSALMPYDPERIILFGSQVRGEADEHSDLDLIIVKETEARFLDRLHEVYDLIDAHFALDVLVYTPAELQEMLAHGNDFLETALEEGVLLYERDTVLGPEPRSVLWERRPVWGTTSMKRDPKAEGQRWLEQAQYDLEVARHNQAGGFYAWTCFLAQQIAEKALKAYLYSQGARRVREHSIQKLVDACLARDPEFAPLSDRVDALDRYYIPTRYPNGLPGGTPARVYKKKDADEALVLAEEALSFVAHKIAPFEE